VDKVGLSLLVATPIAHAFWASTDQLIAEKGRADRAKQLQMKKVSPACE